MFLKIVSQRAGLSLFVSVDHLPTLFICGVREYDAQQLHVFQSLVQLAYPEHHDVDVVIGAEWRSGSSLASFCRNREKIKKLIINATSIFTLFVNNIQGGTGKSDFQIDIPVKRMKIWQIDIHLKRMNNLPRVIFKKKYTELKLIWLDFKWYIRLCLHVPWHVRSQQPCEKKNLVRKVVDRSIKVNQGSREYFFNYARPNYSYITCSFIQLFGRGIFESELVYVQIVKKCVYDCFKPSRWFII